MSCLKGINVKVLFLSIFVASFLLNPTLSTVYAKPQGREFIVFGSISQGRGMVSWGLSFYPREPSQEPYKYGEQEYMATLERSTFVVAGFSSHLTYDTSYNIWMLRDVKSSGVMVLVWNHEGVKHRLVIRVRSVAGTEGIYGKTENEMLLFGVDVDLLIANVENGLDPKNAKMVFRGTLDGERVNGTIHVALSYNPEVEEGSRVVLVNLYINEYNKYVAVLWAEVLADVNIRMHVKLFQ
ncbi:MAG: hypothetical protein ACTSWV_01965 [Candidatus Asgardarchaeia archaeon]